MSNKELIGRVLFSIGFILILSALIIGAITTPKEKIETKCYDRYNNEIINLTCLKDADVNDNVKILVFISVIFFIISGLLILIEVVTK